MLWSSIIFWIIAGSWAIAIESARRRRLSPLLYRPCAGREWRLSFPGASKIEIREFLKLFVDGFAIQRNRYLAFRPSDRVMDIYRAMNPKWVGVDSMELEIFAQLLKKGYRVSLESIWHDGLTLGEVFGETRSG